MKFNNKLSRVEVGKIYFYDVIGMISGLHNGTKTVRVLNLIERETAKPLATVQSVQTNEVFECDSGHLQLNPEYLKVKYHSLMRFYKKNKPHMIYTHSMPRDIGKYLIVGNAPEINCLVLLSKNGILYDFDYDWFENFGLMRNASRDSYNYEEEYYPYEEELPW